MVATATRFASKTMGALVDLLLARRVAVARCAGPLRNEAADALSGRDLSDLLDPRAGLFETAASDLADPIVVGRRGKGQFRGLGGTASYLAHHSPIPLAVIP
jgi:nucleotide-binding universal stress UspA family protein